MLNKRCVALTLFVYSLFFLLLYVMDPGLGPGSFAAQVSNRQAETAYKKARAEYTRLSKSARLRTDRRAWIRVISAFRKVYLAYPDDEDVAPKALFMMARTYRELYGYSHKRKDLAEAIERYEVLVERFPASHLADNGLYALGELYSRLGKRDLARDAWMQIVSEYPKSEFRKSARKRLARLGYNVEQKASRPSTGKTVRGERGGSNYSPSKRPKVNPNKRQKVLSVRYWSEKDYTRVVIDTSGPVTFKKGSLPPNKSKKLPKRFYLDIKPAIKAPKLKSRIGIKDGLLRGVRIAQNNHKTVRVVFDLGKIQKIKAFYLEEPFRIVVDAFGEGYPKSSVCPSPAKNKRGKATSRKEKGRSNGKPLTLAQQLGLCIRRVVIDAGHGGKDPGAIGPTGLREKDVALKIARKVAAKLKKELGVQVILTRNSDRFLPLEQRTAIANAKKADLFLSIHVNSAPNRRLRGIETYFLNFALDEDAMRVAARENATSKKRIGELKTILNDIMRNAKVEESSRFARHVQKKVVASLRRKYSDVKSLGVKQAPFFVLIGARMPSALVEVSFISNRREEKRLKNDRYLDRIARGIVDGIKSYSMETQMAYMPSGR